MYISTRSISFLGFLLLWVQSDTLGATDILLHARHTLSADAAGRAVSAAVKACAKLGYRVSAAVVDVDGMLQAFLRADGAGAHTVDSSRRKAYTAASMRAPTQRFATLVARRPELRALGRMNDSILLLGGGFPIRIRGEIVGGIGVGGAPGARLDEGCARAGLQAVGADLFRPEAPKP